MRWDEIGSQSCSVARTLAVVGDRWSLLVIREAFLRTRRFEDFQRRLGVGRAILASRLDKLVEHGILERRPYQERPRRDEYRLTRKGLDLYPVMMALVRWGDRWADDGAGPPVRHVHRRCGRHTHLVGVCAACGERLDPREVEVEAGPGWRGDEPPVPTREGS